MGIAECSECDRAYHFRSVFWELFHVSLEIGDALEETILTDQTVVTIVAQFCFLLKAMVSVCPQKDTVDVSGPISALQTELIHFLYLRHSGVELSQSRGIFTPGHGQVKHGTVSSLLSRLGYVMP